MIREIGEALGNTVVESVGRAVGHTQERRSLPADVLESDDDCLVVFDAPGVGGSDVQVRFEDHAVQVRFDRFREFHEGFEMRFPGRGLTLDGEAMLPPDAVVDPDRATATLKDNGTLQVRVPKTDGGIDEPDTAEEGKNDDTDDASGADA